LFSTINIAQVTAIDSQSVRVDIDEFKLIIKTFAELNNYKKLYENQKGKEKIFTEIINDKDKIIELKENVIMKLRNEINTIKPAWYNKFSYGFIAGISISILVLIIVR